MAVECWPFVASLMVSSVLGGFIGGLIGDRIEKNVDKGDDSSERSNVSTTLEPTEIFGLSTTPNDTHIPSTLTFEPISGETTLPPARTDDAASVTTPTSFISPRPTMPGVHKRFLSKATLIFFDKIKYTDNSNKVGTT
eukprot:m.306174 g.306174  ORF g.306174 m.306174 type:complete len:138 (+) comp16454_c0_seq29:264-677(+)